MELQLSRRLIVWAIWIGMWFLMVPLARDKGRSRMAWYFYGIAAFYVPFLMLVYGPLFLGIAMDEPGSNTWTKRALEIMDYTIPAGFSLGATCVWRLRSYLRGLNRLNEMNQLEREGL